MTCPLCLANNTRVVFKNSAINRERDVLLCESCNLFFVDPMPTGEELQRLYEQEWSWDYGMSEENSLVKKTFRIVYEAHQKFLAKERANHLFQLLPESENKILEIGSGNGAFLKTISAKYGDVEGIEPSLKADYSEGPVAIRRMAIDEQISLGKQFDAICMYMVLEHLRNPVEILNNLRGALKSGGYLVIEVPFSPTREYENMDDFELFKCFDNVHLFHYSRKNVRQLASRVGTALKEFSVIRKYEFLDGYNVFSVYPNASREGWSYKIPALFNLLVLFGKGVAGSSIHEVIDEESTAFGDGYWIRFVLEK